MNFRALMAGKKLQENLTILFFVFTLVMMFLVRVQGTPSPATKRRNREFSEALKVIQNVEFTGVLCEDTFHTWLPSLPRVRLRTCPFISKPLAAREKKNNH